MTKTLALRAEKILPKIIHENQCGFAKGCYIGENKRLIQDIIDKLNTRGKTWLLLLLDFEKAFDSLEWSYMHQILRKFNFGPQFVNWVKICYTNISSTVINNDFTCGWFSVNRRVRQGCPLSTILFVLCVELLATMVRNNENVEGIKLNGVEHKVSLFADDTTCLLRSVASLDVLFKITNNFAKYSGLKLNIEKSLLYFIGPWRVKPLIPYDVTIVTESFNLLGIELGYNQQKCSEKNFDEKVSKLKTKLNIWSQRGLTLLGKTLIAKSIGVSNLVYSMSCVPSDEKILSTAQRCVNNFIWSGKPSKIKHTTMIGSYSKGGIKSPDLITMKNL